MHTASELKYKIDIVKPDDSSDDGYGEPGTATVVASAYANVTDLTGLELVRAQLIADKVTHRVTVRYDSRILSSMQVIYDGRTFRISAILDVGDVRKVWLQLLCVEIESE